MRFYLLKPTEVNFFYRKCPQVMIHFGGMQRVKIFKIRKAYYLVQLLLHL